MFFREAISKNFRLLEERDKKSKVEIFSKELNDEIYLLCRSEGRKAKETEMRNKAANKKAGLNKTNTAAKIHGPYKFKELVSHIPENYQKHKINWKKSVGKELW